MDDVQRSDRLRIYIEYNEFLGVQQLVDVLNTLDRAYSAIAADVSGAPYPLPPEARLRVDEIRTGNSIELQLVEGLGQLWGQFSTIEVGVTLGVMPLMSRLIVGLARRLRGVRSIWEDGDRTPAEQPDQARQEASGHADAVFHTRYEQEISIDVTRITIQTRREILGGISDMITGFELDSNIVRVVVNQSTIVDKRSATRG